MIMNMEEPIKLPLISPTQTNMVSSNPEEDNELRSLLKHTNVYATFCAWFSSWSRTQQERLVCNVTAQLSSNVIVNLCSSLEPVTHRDYKTSMTGAYPKTPLTKYRKVDVLKRKKPAKTDRKLRALMRRGIPRRDLIRWALTKATVLTAFKSVLPDKKETRNFDIKRVRSPLPHRPASQLSAAGLPETIIEEVESEIEDNRDDNLAKHFDHTDSEVESSQPPVVTITITDEGDEQDSKLDDFSIVLSEPMDRIAEDPSKQDKGESSASSIANDELEKSEKPTKFWWKVRGLFKWQMAMKSNYIPFETYIWKEELMAAIGGWTAERVFHSFQMAHRHHDDQFLDEGVNRKANKVRFDLEIEAKKRHGILIESGFDDQLTIILGWFSKWSDSVQIQFISYIIRLCDPSLVSFLSTCLHKRVCEQYGANCLSDGIILRLFGFLSPKDLMNCSLVCRRWWRLASDDDLWMMKCDQLGESLGVGNISDIVEGFAIEGAAIDWRQAYSEMGIVAKEAKHRSRHLLDEVQPNRDGHPSHRVQSMPHRRRNTVTFADTGFLVSRQTTRTSLLSRGHTDMILYNRKGSAILPRSRAGNRSMFGQLQYQGVTDDDLESTVYGLEPEPLKPWQIKPRVEYRNQPIRRLKHGVIFPDSIERKVIVDNKYSKQLKAKELRKSKERQSVKLPPEKVREQTADSSSDALDIRPNLLPAKDMLKKSVHTYNVRWRKPFETSTQYDGIVVNVVNVYKCKRLCGHMGDVYCIDAFGRRILSGGSDKCLRVWDALTGVCIHKLYGHKGRVACCLATGAFLVSGSWDMNIMLWHPVRFSLQQILSGHKGTVSQLALAFNDNLISSSHDGTLRFWSLERFESLKVIRAHTDAISSIAVFDDVVVSCSYDNQLKLFDCSTFKRVRAFVGHKVAVECVAIRGSLIVSGDRSGKIYFWDVGSSDCEVVVVAHKGAVTAVCFDGNHIGKFYTAGTDCLIKEWDLVTMTCVRILHGHGGPVRSITMSNKPCLLASSSDDGECRVWYMGDNPKE